MVDDTAKTIIRPTAEALSHADPTLFELMNRYIRLVVDRHDLARDAKLLELDRAPSLSLDIGDHEFEVVISQRTTSRDSDMRLVERDNDAPLSANNFMTRGDETRRSVKVNYRPKNGSSKALALLDTLIERMEKDHGVTAVSRPLDKIEFHDTRAEAEATPSKNSQPADG